ncbi:MAG: LemA family protein [Terrimicrobiaceae bacterium]
MLLFFTVSAVFLVGWGIWTFNRLVRARNRQSEAWSGVDVQLRKRAELVPRLVECVAAYRSHEAEVFSAAAAARTPDGVAAGLRGLLAVVEDYPELKAAENFRQLMDQLVLVEDDLQYARRYFNGAVRDLRNLCESFPSNLVAWAFGFRGGEFFEVDDVLARKAPEGGFS